MVGAGDGVHPRGSGTEAPHSGSDTVPTHYRPHLDGIRTIAVYLVVAFHAGLGVLSGGYIGVDIFFVLSGYLVTQVLVRDLAAVGRIRGRQFYARRVRRILPAAAITLVATAVAYSVVASPIELLDALGGFKAAFLYVANWFFIRQSADYFAANVETNPVLQFWSLAVEEQFYLVWPLLFGGLYLATRRFGRWRWSTLRGAVVAAGAASAIWAVYIGRTDLVRAYYGTDTRAYQLLAGAALALTPQLLHLGSRWKRPTQWLAVLCLAVLLLLATSEVDLGPITRGVLTATFALTLLVALENAPGGLVKRVLCSAPFVYLGRISYGVYLWHWPVIVIAAHGRSLTPVTLFALSCVVATVLAAVSFRLIERPIRASRILDRHRGPVIAAGLAASLIFGVFVMPAILDPGSGTVAASSRSKGTSGGPELLDWRVAKDDFVDLPDCRGKPAARCTVVKGAGRRVVLMGDSDAWSWIPTFTEIAKQRGWNFSVLALPRCPWQQHLQVIHPSRFECAQAQADWYDRVLPKLDPDLLILAHQAFDDPLRGLPFVGPDGRGAYPATPQLEPLLTEVSSAALAELRRPGREILILEPIPDPPPALDPLSCLSTGRPPGECSYAAGAPTPLEEFYRRQAKRPGISSLDLDSVVCPRRPTCDAIVDDVIVKRDRNHLTATFARSVADKVAALIPEGPSAASNRGAGGSERDRELVAG